MACRNTYTNEHFLYIRILVCLYVYVNLKLIKKVSPDMYKNF